LARKKSTRRVVKASGLRPLSSPSNGQPSSGSKAARPSALTLMRVDPTAGNALHFVFRDAETERLWRLDPASVHELFALILGGSMRGGRRVLAHDGEAQVEPAEKCGGAPALCMTLGHVEVCIPMEKQALRALSREIERALDP
jgi:hypothetical protein